MKPKKRPDTDRRVRQSERMARVLRVFQLINSKNGPWNPQTIAQELCCSERTVYRDLQVLSMAGVPWFFDELCDSYRVTEGYRFPGVSTAQDSKSSSHQRVGQAALIQEAKDASRQLITSAERVARLMNNLVKALEQPNKTK